MNEQKILDNICGGDKVLGKLCQEAENSYENTNYFAALACLFVITEQIIKYSLDKNGGHYYECLIEANKKEVINEDEFKILNKMRNLRNTIFHENNYSAGIEIKNKYFPLDEDETKKIIYQDFSPTIFNLVERNILKND
jgi:uncharacterized protein YutE (UPF0331/DUF86 family)